MPNLGVVAPKILTARAALSPDAPLWHNHRQSLMVGRGGALPQSATPFVKTPNYALFSAAFRAPCATAGENVDAVPPARRRNGPRVQFQNPDASHRSGAPSTLGQSGQAVGGCERGDVTSAARGWRAAGYQRPGGHATSWQQDAARGPSQTSPHAKWRNSLLPPTAPRRSHSGKRITREWYPRERHNGSKI